MNKEWIIKILENIGHSEKDARGIYDYFESKNDLKALENLVLAEQVIKKT